MTISIIILIAMIIGVVILMTKKDGNSKDDNSKGKNSNNKVDTKVKREDVFKFMEFDRIQDNMIIQKGGSRYTMAIKCKGINYDLMSEVEQMAVEQGFITFLNTLKYPIQLYVQSQNIDLKEVVNQYKRQIVPLEDEYKKYNKLFEEKSGIFGASEEEVDEIDRERNKISNVYEYANDIISYVEKMNLNKNLLQRNFYVLVSYSKGDISAVDKFSKSEIEEMCYTELSTRCSSIISALASSSVVGEVLNSNELADLLYTAYNRDDKSLIGVREALESGFYRLYSTSWDAFQRKSEILKESIEIQAKLKAIESLEKALNEDKYQTDSMIELETEEEISRTATDIVKAENLDPDLKQKAYNNLMSDYRKTKQEYLPRIEREKQQLREEVNQEKEKYEKKYEESELYKINKHKEEVEEEHNKEIQEEKEKLIEIIEANENREVKLDSEEDDQII